MEAIIANEIGELLGDPDLVDYVAGMLADAPSEHESGESIGEFLTSTSADASAADVAAAVAKLFKALRAGGFGKPPPAAKVGGAAGGGGGGGKGKGAAAEEEDAVGGVTRLLEKRVNIGQQDKTLSYGEKGDTGNSSSNGTRYQAWGTSTTAAGSGSAGGNHNAAGSWTPGVKVVRAKRKASVAADKAEAESNEVDAELEAARVAAVKNRAANGAYNGALEAPRFTLPNPGGGQPLLENAALTLVRGRRYGLIGRNGKGKSTLLRALACRRVGEVPPNVTVHYVSQEVKLDDTARARKPVEMVLAADIERVELLKEGSSLEALAMGKGLSASDQQRHAEVLERLELIDSESAPRRADELLTALGFSDELKARPLELLSGGWRVRTMLAAAIFAKPDLLLLDEPTNHLSIGAVLWLARELSEGAAWKDRIMVIVSHDRFFVDAVCSDAMHISGAARRLTQHHGNYSAWHKKRTEQQQAYAKQCALRNAEVEKLREYADHGFKFGGSTGQLNQMARKMKQAERIEEQAAAMNDELASLQEDVDLPIKLLSGGHTPGFLIQLKDVGFGYPGGPTLFDGAEMGINTHTRLVLLGENGNGKTTLLKLLLGELEPTSGIVTRANVRVALVNQHSADQLDLGMTPLEFMTDRFPCPKGTISAYDHGLLLRSHLASCGVPGGNKDGTVIDQQTLPMQALSGGQRSRVALAAVSYARPHILVLDEPTNNLDLESVSALAESVKAFEGAVILVSHDQFFVNEVAHEAWVVGKGKVTRVESFEAYRMSQMAKLAKTSI